MLRKAEILLADDDFEDRLIIADAFNEIGNGVDVKYVEDGEQVLDYLHPIADPEHMPALIILDLNMPRLSGTEVLKIVKQSERFAHIPVIIFSTSINEREKEDCLNAGAASYVVKPSKYMESLEIARFFCSFTFCKEDAQFA